MCEAAAARAPREWISLKGENLREKCTGPLESRYPAKATGGLVIKIN